MNQDQTAAGRLERLEFVRLLLQRRHAHMAAAVLRLGVVTFTDAVDTAGILAQGARVQLFFNETFLDAIDNFELSAVLVHEALHFLFRHPERAAQIHRAADRFLFNLACEAVVNDLIVYCFKEFRLPGRPVTGPGLVGYSVHDRSAEQVLQLLRQSAQISTQTVTLNQTLDDHELWVAPVPDPSQETPRSARTDKAPLWSTETSSLVNEILQALGRRDPCYSSSPLGVERTVPQSRQRTRADLGRFLGEAVRSTMREDLIWTRPPPGLRAVYPEVILPAYEPQPEWRVLIALDTSGSVPHSFLAVGRQIALEHIPQTTVTVVSFDTATYAVHQDMKALRGGGGTRVQAVEEYAVRHFPRYPDAIFVLTDGFTPRPKPSHPERWIWILPPWGSTTAIPEQSRKEFFNVP